MTRPAARVVTAVSPGVAALSAACVATLVWCAWLLVASDLPLGATVAAWMLWLVAVAAATTLVAYVRELLRYRPDVAAGASWRPLPGLLLLWVAGLAAVVSFPFMLPRGGTAAADASHGATGAGQGPARASGGGTSGGTAVSPRTPTGLPTTSGAPTTATGAPEARTVSPTPAGLTRPTPAAPSSSVAGVAGSTTSAPSATASSASPTPTSTPLLGVTLPARPGKRLGTLPRPTKH